MILEAMPVLEHQHLRGVELVGADHRGQVVGLFAGKGDEERVVEQIFGVDVAARLGEREQDTVDGAVVARLACLRARSAERRVGKGCGRPVRSWLAPWPY